MIVGARRRRAETGTRVRLNVVLYEPGDGLWAYAVTDAHQRPIAHSSHTDGSVGHPLSVVSAALHTVLDVQLQRDGSRLVRADERWDVSVRVVGGNDELPFRVS